MDVAPDVGIARQDDWPYGPNIDDAMRTKLVTWAETNDLRLVQTRNLPCPHWVIGKRPGWHDCELRKGANWLDHVTLWRNRTTGGRMLLAQPYGLGRTDLHKLADLGDRLDVRVHAGGTCWYGHGTTGVLVVPISYSARLNFYCGEK